MDGNVSFVATTIDSNGASYSVKVIKNISGYSGAVAAQSVNAGDDGAGTVIIKKDGSQVSFMPKDEWYN